MSSNYRVNFSLFSLSLSLVPFWSHLKVNFASFYSPFSVLCRFFILATNFKQIYFEIIEKFMTKSSCNEIYCKDIKRAAVLKVKQNHRKKVGWGKFLFSSHAEEFFHLKKSSLNFARMCHLQSSMITLSSKEHTKEKKFLERHRKVWHRMIVMAIYTLAYKKYKFL